MNDDGHTVVDDAGAAQIASDTMDQLIGKRVVAFVALDRHFSFAFDDGTFLWLTVGGWEGDHYVEVDDEAPND